MHARAVSPVVTALLCAGTLLVAQAPAGLPTSGARPQTPPRDAPPLIQTGTAIIKGRIVAAESGRPLRRAHITASATELGRQGRDASTDADGRYELTDLPAGRYSLTVSRSGYLRLSYGQVRPLGQGKTLDVANGQQIEKVDFALPKMSVIAGRLTDELGDPIEGASIFAMSQEYFSGRRRVVPVSQVARSDDAGQFRIGGLMPGTYWVMATIRETWTTVQNGKVDQMGYAPTFLPGTTNLSDAQRVTLGIGEQVITNDFGLVPGRAARVSGTATDAHGRLLEGGDVSISQETVGPGGGSFMTVGGSPVAADGTFAITRVPPGEYKIRATSSRNGQPGAAPEVITQVLVVDGQDIEGLRLTTSAGWSMAGQIRTETGDPPTMARSRLNITTNSVDPDLEPRMSGMNTTGQVHDDWTFSVTNIFGPSRVQLNLPTGWAVKAILLGDRDVTDEPLDMRSGEVLAGIDIVVSNRLTRVVGQLSDSKGALASEGTVLIFAIDSTKWFDRSRWVQIARPDSSGHYEMAGLPAGNYFAMALDYVPDRSWNDPEFLTTLARRAQKTTLSEAQSATLPLNVLQAQQ